MKKNKLTDEQQKVLDWIIEEQKKDEYIIQGIHFNTIRDKFGFSDSEADDLLFELAYASKVYMPRPDHYKALE